MADITITSANSEYMLAIAGLFNVPQALSGYAADAAFASDAFPTAETLMGVDGKMSAGWVPSVKVQTISLQADSPSVTLFETWYASQQAIRELYFAAAIIILPSVGKKFRCVKGVLTNYTPIANAGRVLQPQPFQITWESVMPMSV